MTETERIKRTKEYRQIRDSLIDQLTDVQIRWPGGCGCFPFYGSAGTLQMHVNLTCRENREISLYPYTI